MQIEIAITFTATHQHRIPPGVMSEKHPHEWEWTVEIAGPIDPEFGWVADFERMRALMDAQTVPHFEGTTEQLLRYLVADLIVVLPDGLQVMRARLQEKPGQAALWEA